MKRSERGWGSPLQRRTLAPLAVLGSLATPGREQANWQEGKTTEGVDSVEEAIRGARSSRVRWVSSTTSHRGRQRFWKHDRAERRFHGASLDVVGEGYELGHGVALARTARLRAFQSIRIAYTLSN